MDFRSSRGAEGAIDVPVSLPQIRSSVLFNKKLEEYLDRRNNWIFYGTDSLLESTAKASKAKEFSLDKENSKPKKAMERFLEDKPERRNQASEHDSANSSSNINESDRALKLMPSKELDKGASNAPMSEFNLNQYLRPSSSEEIWPGPANDSMRNLMGAPAFGETSTPSEASRSERKRLNQEREDEFQKLLQPNGSPRATAGILDPINLQPDATRQELNPIVPKRIEGESSSLSRAENLDPARAFRPSPNFGRSSALEAFNSRLLGASSLSPAVTVPIAPPVSFQAKPAVLEFPRRKF